jgi:hypothetical protein
MIAKKKFMSSANSIHEEIKSRLKSGNACYHSVQNLLSCRLLPKNTKIRVYRTIILPVVLYGCETWSLTLREEQRLRVFENRVLRRILGPKRDEATGDWRRLHNEELNDLYSSPNIIGVIKSRRMRWAGHVARMGEKRSAHRILVRRPEGTRPLGRPRRRWEDNIEMDLLVFLASCLHNVGKTLTSSECGTKRANESLQIMDLFNPHNCNIISSCAR